MKEQTMQQNYANLTRHMEDEKQFAQNRRQQQIHQADSEKKNNICK